MSAKDRLIAVANSSSFNGIDFIEVASPTELVVHFLNSVPVNAPAPTATITGGDSITDIALRCAWAARMLRSRCPLGFVLPSSLDGLG